MNPDLERLIQLQAADQQIARLNQEISELPRRVAVIESKLADTKTQVATAKQKIGSTQTDRRRLESEINSLQQKISKYRDQSLEVRTNEQYKALLQEIQFAETEIRAFEDKILDGMVATESFEKEQKAAEVELKEETAEIEKEKAEARSRTAEDLAQLAEWNGKRDALRSAISPDSVRYYDRVHKLRGSAIAEARGQICMACHVMLRPQTYNDVRGNEQIIACDSCGRILYYDPANEPPDAAAPRPRRGTEEEATSETPAAQ
jgi:predicted  nucleic acid-binding Zn-ribbon protein